MFAGRRLPVSGPAAGTLLGPTLGAVVHLRTGLPVAVLLSVIAGRLYALAFPPAGVWLLAVCSVGTLLITLRGRTFFSGALVGLGFGAAFWFSLIDWVALFLGPLPLLALGGLQTALLSAGCGLISVAYRYMPLLRDSVSQRVVVTPLVVGAAWTAREVVAGTWPYGGFSWGRLAFSQSESPFAPLASWLGSAGVGFVLAAAIAFMVAIATEPGEALRPAHSVIPIQLVVGSMPLLVLALVPGFPMQSSGSMRIAAVQPNTHAGYFDPLNDPARNLAAITRVTEAADLRGVDLVVWPEGAAQYDPLSDSDARSRLDRLTARTGAPLITGAITNRDGAFYNSSVLWLPGVGPTGVYDKVRPVPFGEYVPDRSFWTVLAPNLLAQVGRDYRIGQRSSVFDVGGVKVAVSICFDIVDDGLILGAIADQPEVLLAQTNNADFGTTAEHLQQLAIARVRALETGRALVSSSTVASTSMIGPDGATIAASRPFTPRVLIADVPRSTGTTPAALLGVRLAASLAFLGVTLPVLARHLVRRKAT